MSKKKCEHNSFWDIYKVINFNRSFSDNGGRNFKCSQCGAKCSLKWKGYKKMKKNPIQRFATYFMWLLPALVLMYWVAALYMSAELAIALVILYHFAAMYYISKSSHLKISCK